MAFFLTDAFASLDVTAAIVAHDHITKNLGLREELSGYVITSYLYPMFAVLVLALVFHRWIGRVFSPRSVFLTGLTVFVVGNIACFIAPNPFAFFAGRMFTGSGAAFSFVGQLWTVSVHHRHRIARPLAWGETGAALGDLAGPVLGGLFAQAGQAGWRWFFLFNAVVGFLAAGFARFGLDRKRSVDIPETGGIPENDPAGGRIAGIMIAWQVAVSILLVGSAYFLSDQLQGAQNGKLDESPLVVSAMGVLASLGSMLGSWWASRLRNTPERTPFLATIGLLLSLAAVAGCIATRNIPLAGVPVFVSGILVGLANVSIYSSIVKFSRQDMFLHSTIAYLIGMQIGNALGVQAVGIAEWLHCGTLASALLLACVPATIALYLCITAKLRPASSGRSSVE